LFQTGSTSAYRRTRVLLAPNGNTPNITNVTGLSFNDINGKTWAGSANVGDVITFNGPTVGSQTLITETISGPATEDAANTYTINPTLQLENGNCWMRMWVDPDGLGNTGADRLVRIRANRRNNGTANIVSMAPISALQEGNTVTPSVSVSSGQTPFITVLAGPATINNGQLTITRIPAGKDTVMVVLRIAAAGNGTYQTSAVVETGFKVAQTIVGLGNDGNKFNSVNIYPNPATATVTISSNSKGKVYLANSVGQIVMQAEHFGFNSQLNVASLNKGVYFLKFESNSGSIVKRFVKL
jgi:hypothetical protein